MEYDRDFNADLPSIVLGGGGAFGIGYESGILDSFKARGVDLSTAQMLGTSAGSWVGGFVATGIEFDDVASMQQIKVPNLKPGYLKGFAKEVFGDASAANVFAMALRLPSVRDPRFRAEMLNGGEHGLADIAVASSSVPFVFAPAKVGGNYYLDGGVRSIVSADLAPKSHRVLAIAAFGESMKLPLGKFQLPVGWAIEQQLHRELGKWKEQNGGDVTFIRPNEEIAKMIKNPMDCFDFEIAKEVYWMARAQGEALINDPRRSLGSQVLRMAQKQPA